MNNTIILLKDEKLFTRNEYKKFSKGDLIFGDNNAPTEVKRWDITDEAEAKKELAKHKCEYREYRDGGCYSVTEYALLYCECDEEGDVVGGGDYEFANEKE